MTDLQLATKLMWAAHQMKRDYVVAGTCVALVFCQERDIDGDAIERIIVTIGAVRGGDATYEDAQNAVHAHLS